MAILINMVPQYGDMARLIWWNWRKKGRNFRVTPAVDKGFEQNFEYKRGALRIPDIFPWDLSVCLNDFEKFSLQVSGVMREWLTWLHWLVSKLADDDAGFAIQIIKKGRTKTVRFHVRRCVGMWIY